MRGEDLANKTPLETPRRCNKPPTTTAQSPYPSSNHAFLSTLHPSSTSSPRRAAPRPRTCAPGPSLPHARKCNTAATASAAGTAMTTATTTAAAAWSASPARRRACGRSWPRSSIRRGRTRCWWVRASRRASWTRPCSTSGGASSACRLVRRAPSPSVFKVYATLRPRPMHPRTVTPRGPWQS